jgi:hypothetical protein
VLLKSTYRLVVGAASLGTIRTIAPPKRQRAFASSCWCTWLLVSVAAGPYSFGASSMAEPLRLLR